MPDFYAHTKLISRIESLPVRERGLKQAYHWIASSIPADGNLYLNLKELGVSHNLLFYFKNYALYDIVKSN